MATGTSLTWEEAGFKSLEEASLRMVELGGLLKPDLDTALKEHPEQCTYFEAWLEEQEALAQSDEADTNDDGMFYFVYQKQQKRPVP